MQCVFSLCCNLDLEVVPEYHLYDEQQPPKQVHPKLWYRNPEKKGKIWRIRGKYPDPLGQYVGFMPGRLG
jgi:hypothetical protein